MSLALSYDVADNSETWVCQDLARTAALLDDRVLTERLLAQAEIRVDAGGNGAPQHSRLALAKTCLALEEPEQALTLLEKVLDQSVRYLGREEDLRNAISLLDELAGSHAGAVDQTHLAIARQKGAQMLQKAIDRQAFIRLDN